MTSPESGAASSSGSGAASGSGSGSGSWVLGGRYRVLERIGSGGMAEVFRAHDEVLARDVAVKVFRRVSTTPDTAAGAARQRTELQALAQLAHPNLITLFDGSLEGDDGSPAYLVMELIDGATLANAIERDAVSAAEVRAIGAQIGSALAYVHAANMVHRDVKPANILLGTDATAGGTTVRARLSDFGIVRLIGDDGHTGTQFTLGTASYLAPEQARGSSVGPPADVYALGLVLLEALTRIRAFDGPPIEAAMARLNRDPDIPSNLPAPWPQLIASMTQRDPAQRPTAQQVVDVLGRPDGATGATSPIVAPIAAPVLPTAATAVVAAEALGPVRRAPVNETRAMPTVPPVSPVPPVGPPVQRTAASGPPPRKGLPTLVWLALAAAVVVLIIVVVALMATSGSGSSPTPDTSSSSTRPSNSATSAPSSRPASSTTTHKHRSSSSAPPSTKASTPSTTATTKKAPGPPTHRAPAPPTTTTTSKPTPKPPGKTAGAKTTTPASPTKTQAAPPGG